MSNSTFRTLRANQIEGINASRNYIANGAATDNTAGWATYANAAQSSPVTGTGGSPSVTWTRTTVTPLSLDASFLFTKDAVNRQGQGVAFPFTIQDCDRAKVLQIQFEYAVASGTFAAGSSSADSDITVWIYDVTNGVLIQPSTYRLFASSSLSTTFVSNFQTAANSTSYRLIFHCATTSASAYTVEFDDIRVSPSQYVYGTPITDWTTNWTPTGSWVANTTYTGRWRRVGDNLEAFVRIGTSGAPTATQLTVTLPNGLTVDSNKVPANAVRVGQGYAEDAGVTGFDVMVLTGGGQTFVTPLAIGAASTYTVTAALNATVPFTFGANDFVNINFSVPIAGWSSSVQTSDQADSRVVSAVVSSSSTQNILSATETVVTANTVSKDTHSAYSSNRFTVPVSGDYWVSSQIVFSAVAVAGATGGIYLRARVNGSTLWNLAAASAGPTASTTRAASGSTLVPNLRAGDYIEITCYQDTGTTLTTAASIPFTSFNRVAQASLISATETVAMSGFSSSSTSCNNTTVQIPLGGVLLNTHNTISGNQITIPVAGCYDIAATCIFGTSGLATNNHSLIMRVNGIDRLTETVQGATLPANLQNHRLVLCAGLRLNAGDVVTFHFNCNFNQDVLITLSTYKISRIGI